MAKNLKNKNGAISEYGFACGYVQEYTCKGCKVSLRLAEGGTYLVLYWDLEQSVALEIEVTPSLKSARTFFKYYKSMLMHGMPEYKESNPKIDFYTSEGVYTSSSNWYKNLTHALAWNHELSYKVKYNKIKG